SGSLCASYSAATSCSAVGSTARSASSSAWRWPTTPTDGSASYATRRRGTRKRGHGDTGTRGERAAETVSVSPRLPVSVPPRLRVPSGSTEFGEGRDLPDPAEKIAERGALCPQLAESIGDLGGANRSLGVVAVEGEVGLVEPADAIPLSDERLAFGLHIGLRRLN